MSDLMKTQTVMPNGVENGKTYQRFGKVNSLSNAKEEIEVVTVVDNNPNFVELTVSTGGSPCWVSVALKRVKETKRGPVASTIGIDLDKITLLQLIENLKEIVNQVQPLSQVRPDLFRTE